MKGDRITVDVNNPGELSALIYTIMFETQDSANRILEENGAVYRVVEIPNVHTVILEKVTND
jgi:hypothetical protein